MNHRTLLSIVRIACLLGLTACAGFSTASIGASDEWPEWNRFATRFLQDDGRIVDRTFDQKSTSEGQSYGLFFALVANDRPRFNTILNWTATNLAGNQLGDRLPGWLWGKKDDGSWGLKDANAAPDGTLWTAYALLEAGRLWHAPDYTLLGKRLLHQCATHDVADSAAGKVLLALSPETVDKEQRLPIDPSYMPPFQLLYFSEVDPNGPWRALLETYQKLAPGIFVQGIAPDLLRIKADGSLELYPGREIGSYDAIRVYLWAAMSGDDGKRQVSQLKHFAELIRTNGVPPEKINATTGAAIKGDFSPIGFIAAAIPFLKASGEPDLAGELRIALKQARDKSEASNSANYYDEALALFALGFTDGYYRFDDHGRLHTPWEMHLEMRAGKTAAELGDQVAPSAAAASPG